MAFGKDTVDWTEEEFKLLGDTIMLYVSRGDTVVDACREFERLTNGLRSFSSARFKAVTRIAKERADEYEIAKTLGKQAKIDRITAGHASRPRTANVVQMFESTTGEGDDTVSRISQSDFRRQLNNLLRSVEIVPDDYTRIESELERTKSQLADAKREIEQLRHEKLLLTKKYDESKVELESLVQAMNVARKYATNTQESSNTRIVIGRDGTVSTVKAE